MRLILRAFLSLIVLALLGAGGFVLCARSGLLTPDEAALRARYMLPTSKFIEINGEQIHYSDEGSGDTILLIHGGFGSLLNWNDWAKALSGHYRIVRFDRPPSGLSGRDPNNRYDEQHEVAIIEGLADKLGLDKFFLVATSGGGASGVEYAAKHPEHIEGAVFSGIAVGPNRPLPGRYAPLFRKIVAIDPYFKVWRPGIFWRLTLEANMVNHDRISDALVRQYADFNNRAIIYEAMGTPNGMAAAFARVPDELGKITAPTLFLWPENDGDTPVEPTATDGMKYSGAQDKALAIVPHCEHMVALDCGPESVALAIPFFDRVSAAAHETATPKTPAP